jgi:hypothetical protein
MKYCVPLDALVAQGAAIAYPMLTAFAGVMGWPRAPGVEADALRPSFRTARGHYEIPAVANWSVRILSR